MNNQIFYAKQILALFLELVLFIIILALSLSGYFIFIYPLLNDMDMSHIDFESMLEDNPMEMLLINYIPISLITLLVMWLVHVVLFSRQESLLGFNKKGALVEFGYGWIMGSILIVLGFIILIVFDQIDIIGRDTKWLLIGGFLLMFLIQSFSEEILFRSYLIPTIENRLGTWAALIISSLGFMALHLGNSGISFIGCLDLTVGGFLMGLLFIKFRNVWAPTGLHVSWNYMQSTILGFEVSGVKTYSWLSLDEKGNDFLTGGEFGYEGSIFSVLFLILSVLFIFKMYPDIINQFSFPQNNKADENKYDHF